ncbi:Hematopoietic prostaglandin D synthase [Lamellibrachia satsuma]|nr:Hematopoietic prostaglandin D synthase [Lamellibrachia satsuma]
MREHSSEHRIHLKMTDDHGTSRLWNVLKKVVVSCRHWRDGVALYRPRSQSVKIRNTGSGEIRGSQITDTLSSIPYGNTQRGRHRITCVVDDGSCCDSKETQYFCTKTGTVPSAQSTMPKYVLTYFNYRARAELARLLFAVNGTEYDDERVTSIEQWNRTKPETPFGSLPVLLVNDVKICQSLTISRFLAREFGLAGKTSLEKAKTDMVVECVDDMLAPIMPAYREQNQEKKLEMQLSYEKELPCFMRKMENLFEANNNGSGYFVGDEMTWADLAVMNSWHWIPGFGVYPPLEKYPKLKAHKERIEAHPRVADWLERRPVTPV